MTQSVDKALADGNLGVYQVNGAYSISSTQLITKCRLEGPDETLSKKTRVYTITKNTKFYEWKDYDSKKRLTGSKLKKAIKKANRKNVTFQFKAKKNKVTYIAFM
jgi:hypothetical protein